MRKGQRVPSQKGPSIEAADRSGGEGSIWELVLFAVLFVVIFSAVARA